MVQRIRNTLNPHKVHRYENKMSLSKTTCQNCKVIVNTKNETKNVKF